MLVSFSVKNYRSFAEKQNLSLVAGASSKKNKHFSFETSNSLAPYLLRSVCIFGANGAGKSSLVKAMDFFRDFVTTSAKEIQEGEGIDIVSNSLCAELQNQPSEFEIIFIHGEGLYQYGFSVDKERVYGEWLFSKPNTEKSRTRILFQREYDKTNDSYIWDINNTFIRGEKEVWKKSTRSNALFLSQAVQLNAMDLKEPFDWIQKYLRVIESPDRLSHVFTARQCVEKGWKDKVLTLLQSVDIKIQDIEIEIKDIDPSDFPDDMPKAIKDALLEGLKGKKSKAFKVASFHKDDAGNLVTLGFHEESDGTNVLFGLSGPLLDVLENGYSLVVDELHNSLHPHALKTLISLFHNPEINKNNAQIIFTSHETSVMIKGFMHQDQIWLAEKNDSESTQLIPLSDYKVRDISNFQKAYLDGRYGGVPKLKEFIHG